ncbi:MAG: M1 family metallopeptidase [Pleurocapsa sp. SU_196_0]|nr:M1 family metallopeptidase [Pleurocapsa sp. SU_196_0]
MDGGSSPRGELRGVAGCGAGADSGRTWSERPDFRVDGNGGYDAQDYDINLRFSSDKRSAMGVTTMEALATQDLSQFNLDFGTMSVSSITVNGAAARFQQSDPELVVMPAQPLKTGEWFRVTVTYAGTPGSASNPNEFGDEAFWLLNNNTLTVLSQPSGMFMWSPVNEHPSDKATFTVALTAPKTDTAVVSGVLTGSVDNADGSRTTTFRIGTPTTTYVVMFSVGNYDSRSRARSVRFACGITCRLPRARRCARRCSRRRRSFRSSTNA